MLPTLSLNRRTHLFVKDHKFYIKLQKPNTHKPTAPDFYMIKTLNMNELRQVRDWANQILESEINNGTSSESNTEH